MKTAEEKAKKYADDVAFLVPYDGTMNFYDEKRLKTAEIDYLAGYNEAMRWINPKDELPNEGEEVQLKIFETYHNKQEYTHDVYLGDRWRFCESKYIEVLGWRPLNN